MSDEDPENFKVLHMTGELLQYAPTYLILVHLLPVPMEVSIDDRDYFAG